MSKEKYVPNVFDMVEDFAHTCLAIDPASRSRWRCGTRDSRAQSRTACWTPRAR